MAPKVAWTSPDQGALAGQVSYDAETHTAIFDPEEAFAGEATFTATLRRAITDLAGNALEAEYSWSFSTGSAAAPDASGPTIVSTTPAAGLRGVSPDTAITVTFSEALAPHTLTSSSVRLTRGVKGRISYDPESYTVTFIPYRSLLRPGATYKVMLSSDIADLAGNTFGGYQFTFTTGQ